MQYVPAIKDEEAILPVHRKAATVSGQECRALQVLLGGDQETRPDMGRLGARARQMTVRSGMEWEVRLHQMDHIRDQKTVRL